MKSLSDRGGRLTLAALAIVGLTVITRVPLLLMHQPIDDEAVYVVVGNEIAAGGQPYVSAVERKPPLLLYTYAAISKLAGPYNALAVHLTSVLWVLATMAGLFVAGAGLHNAETGLIAALLYGVFQPWGYWNNLAFNGESMINLPIVWAYAVAFARPRARRRWELLLAGALLATAFLLKQPAAIAAIPLGVYLLSPGYRASRVLRVRDSVRHATIMTGAYVAVLAGAAAALWRNGLLGEAWYWTFTNHDVRYVFWSKGAEHTAAFVAICGPVVIGAAAGAWWTGPWQRARAERAALWGLALVSAVGAAASGRFYPHYYIAILPALSLLAAPVYRQVWEARGEARSMQRMAAVTSQLWIAVCAGVFLLAHVRGLGRLPPSTDAAEYVRAHSQPDDRIFVWGQAARVYLDAQRRPAARYVTTFPLTGQIFGPPLPGIDTSDRIVPGAWQHLEHDFSVHPPVFVVDTEAGPAASYAVKRFPALETLLAARYTPVARNRDTVVYALREPFDSGSRGVRQRLALVWDRDRMPVRSGCHSNCSPDRSR